MKLGFEEEGAVFEGATQNARVWSENWVERQLYCPCCGAERVIRYGANQPVADFYCGECREDFELKASKAKFGAKVVDGAYDSMMRRLSEGSNPSLVLMNYHRADLRVTDLAIVPKHFFVPDLIEARKPLAQTARRAGWKGCNIRLGDIPKHGIIPIIRAGMPEPKEEVLRKWSETSFLAAQTLAARGWLLDVLKCVEQVGKNEFLLSDIYAFEPRLQQIYPGNSHVREKIRQQLQVLRDHGILEFLGRGAYRLKRG